MEVSINTNAMKVNYEQKPCYDIVFSKDFNLLNDEIQKLNISNKRICIVTESNVQMKLKRFLWAIQKK